MSARELPIPRSVRPGLRFLPPARNQWLLPLAPFGSWLYVKFGNRITRIETHGLDRLVNAYRDLQDGRSRLIVAFRHPGVEDGTLIFHLMSSLVGKEARRIGVRLRTPPGGAFLYGRDVPEWAGRFLQWMLPLIGAISVFPGKVDSQSIEVLRRYMTEARHPIALAPEGQVVYHNERVAKLEPGTGQLAFWCLEDLRKQGRSEDVVIVPVCTSYHYREQDWRALESLVGRLEAECGLRGGKDPAHSAAPLPPATASGSLAGALYPRILGIERRLLDLAEDHYARFHRVSFPALPGTGGPEVRQERMRRVCEAALRTAESFFGLSAKGDFVQRVMAARYAGLARIYREDITDLGELSPLEKSLADRIAAESWLRLRHMELVDVLEYLRADYLESDSSIDRFVETTLNLWDVANRLEGGNISGHPNPLSKTARIIVNEPIPVSGYLDAYKGNRRKAVAEVTDRVLASFRSVAEAGNAPLADARRES